MKAPKCKLCGEHHWALCTVSRAAVSALVPRVVVEPPKVKPRRGGRPRVHATNAERQKAYRQRAAAVE